MSASPSGETKPESTDLDKAQALITAIQAGDAQGVLDAIKDLTKVQAE